MRVELRSIVLSSAFSSDCDCGEELKCVFFRELKLFAGVYGCEP